MLAPEEARMLALQNMILGVGHQSQNQTGFIGNAGRITE